MFMSPRRIASLLVILVLVVVVAVFGLRSNSNSKRQAPALPTRPLVGAPVTVAQLRGEPTFVVFWASWCHPCQKEAPAIESFARREVGHAHVIGVDWTDDAGSARKFIATHRWTFASMRDPNGTVGDNYGLVDLPTTFVLNSRGEIVAKLVGMQTVGTLSTALGRAT
jgi:thiol-disulfide isomerase/thioredoxin